MSYIFREKTISWNESKSEWLRKKRGIGFEEIAFLLAGDGLVDIIDHPDPHRHPRQRIFIVRFGSQILSVPFVEDEGAVFLKTVFPSRKMKRIYEIRQSDKTR
jgi:uncharacterized DUF497 family protein